MEDREEGAKIRFSFSVTQHQANWFVLSGSAGFGFLKEESRVTRGKR